jgi:hypothetical protein
MDDTKRLELIAEAVRYCQNVKALGMPASCYAKALREPVHFLWERRAGSKIRCAQFRSTASSLLRFGKGELVYDHAVPFGYLQDELLSLNPVTEQAVARALDRFGTIVLITKAENARLDAAGYGRKMPKGWDGVDPLARYRALAIDLTENTNG